MNRCAAPGCGRWTRVGAHYCGRHDPHESDGQIAAAAVENGANGPVAFRARLATGDYYEEVIGAALRRVLQGAAAKPALEDEFGALRVALARLLHEERDPSRLAAGVARVAGVAVQVEKLRGESDADQQGFLAALAKAAEEIEREGLFIAVRPQDAHETSDDQCPSPFAKGEGLG